MLEQKDAATAQVTGEDRADACLEERFAGAEDVMRPPTRCEPRRDRGSSTSRVWRK